MPNKYSCARSAAMRLELLSALLDCRSERLMEATVAGCAVVAHADGEVSPQEVARMFSMMRTDPLMSMFPRDGVAFEFDLHVWAWQENAGAARAAALKQIRLLAPQPCLGRIVLQACMDVTHADGRVHPRAIEAIAQVREALGLDPRVGGTAADTTSAAAPRGGAAFGSLRRPAQRARPGGRARRLSNDEVPEPPRVSRRRLGVCYAAAGMSSSMA